MADGRSIGPLPGRPDFLVPPSGRTRVNKHCIQCGEQLHSGIPEGDDRERDICSSCQTVHYINPVVVVGCIASWQSHVLLCRRAIEPRVGSWTLPSGFLELDETTEQGALRECREETGARVRSDGFYSLINLPSLGEVHIIYRGTLLDPYVHAGTECLDVGLFTRETVPWQELAYSSIAEALQHYFDDMQSGSFPMRVLDTDREDVDGSLDQHPRLTGHL